MHHRVRVAPEVQVVQAQGRSSERKHVGDRDLLLWLRPRSVRGGLERGDVRGLVVVEADGRRRRSGARRARLRDRVDQRRVLGDRYAIAADDDVTLAQARFVGQVGLVD